MNEERLVWALEAIINGAPGVLMAKWARKQDIPDAAQQRLDREFRKSFEGRDHAGAHVTGWS